MMASRRLLLAGRVVLFALMLVGTTNSGVVDASVFEIHDFQFYYGDTMVFHDDFEDGLIPTIPPYDEVQGALGMSESGGILSMNTALASPFLGGTPLVMISQGGAGFIQGVFTDIAPLDGERSAGIAIGNNSSGGLVVGINNPGSGPLIFFAWSGGSFIDQIPISGFTGTGTVTLRLNLYDLDTNDGKFEIQPSYWFNSDPAQSLSVVQLSLHEWPGYFSSGAKPSAPVPIPGAMYLFGAGLVGLVGLRKKLRK